MRLESVFWRIAAKSKILERIEADSPKSYHGCDSKPLLRWSMDESWRELVSELGVAGCLGNTAAS